MRRVSGALVAIAVLLATACTANAHSSGPSAKPSAKNSTPSVSVAWDARETARPDWVGRSAPWAWEHGDDVVILTPRGLAAVDLETGAESWKLPLGGTVCGAAKSPSPAGLIAVIVGQCAPDYFATRAGDVCCTGEPANAERTTVKVIDLESASVVWERDFMGSPVLDIGGEVLLTVTGCQLFRWDLASGTPLGDIGTGCKDYALVGQGVVVVTKTLPVAGDGAGATSDWRVVDVATGKDLFTTAVPADVATVQALPTDPVTVLGSSDYSENLYLVDGDGAHLLAENAPMDGYAVVTGDTLLFRHPVYGDTDDVSSSLARVSLHDGSPVRELPYTEAEGWIPVGVADGSVVMVDGSLELDGLSAGHGRVTAIALSDGEVTVLGDVGGDTFIGDTNYQVAAPKAVIIGDLLLMPGHGNHGVIAYRLTLPAAG